MDDFATIAEKLSEIRPQDSISFIKSQLKESARNSLFNDAIPHVARILSEKLTEINEDIDFQISFRPNKFFIIKAKAPSGAVNTIYSQFFDNSHTIEEAEIKESIPKERPFISWDDFEEWINKTSIGKSIRETIYRYISIAKSGVPLTERQKKKFNDVINHLLKRIKRHEFLSLCKISDCDNIDILDSVLVCTELTIDGFTVEKHV